MQLAVKTKRTVGAAGGRPAKERMGAAQSEDGRRRWPTVVAVVSLLAAGCGGGNSPTNNPDGGNPDAGMGAITASIDGASWSSSVQHTASYSNPVFSFLGSNGSLVITVATVMRNGPGTYSLAYGNLDGSSAAVGNAAGASWGTVLPGGTGSITISTFTSNHAVGTFSFDVVPISGATNTLHITNGRFDLTF